MTRGPSWPPDDDAGRGETRTERNRCVRWRDGRAGRSCCPSHGRPWARFSPTTALPVCCWPWVVVRVRAFRRCPGRFCWGSSWCRPSHDFRPARRIFRPGPSANLVRRRRRPLRRTRRFVRRSRDALSAPDPSDPRRRLRRRWTPRRRPRWPAWQPSVGAANQLAAAANLICWGGRRPDRSPGSNRKSTPVIQLLVNLKNIREDTMPSIITYQFK